MALLTSLVVAGVGLCRMRRVSQRLSRDIECGVSTTHRLRVAHIVARRQPDHSEAPRYCIVSVYLLSTLYTWGRKKKTKRKKSPEKSH